MSSTSGVGAKGKSAYLPESKSPQQVQTLGKRHYVVSDTLRQALERNVAKHQSSPSKK